MVVRLDLQALPEGELSGTEPHHPVKEALVCHELFLPQHSEHLMSA